MGKNTGIWFAVVNPNAGSGKTLAEWREAETMLFEKGIQYKFVTPESTIDSTEKIQEACRNGYRNFIAVGGDGTIHQLIKSILNYERTTRNTDAEVSLDEFKLAVLPIGSGNDWIRSHNVPKDHKKIIELIAKDSFARQDIVQADVLDPENPDKITKTAYMANVGGYNFDANVCDVVNFQKANGVTGKALYIKALLNIAFHQKPAGTDIVCDGRKVFSAPLYSISLGNGRYSGGGLRQTPSAVMDDGLVDLMVVPKFQMWKVPFYIKPLLNGKLEKVPFLHFFKASDVVIKPQGQGQLVEVDGEIIGRAPVHFKVLPEQISVLHVNSDEQV